MKFIKKVPIPLAGVMLGFAALGNLLQSYSEGIRSVCGIVAGVLLVLLILKLVCFPGMIREDMKNPIMASVFCTFPMALMLFSVYFKPWFGAASLYIWYLAIALHIVMIIYFTKIFVLKPDLKKVHASYYIVYVGIAMAAMTAPAYEATGLGMVTFWFGFATLLILIVFVTMRYVKLPAPDPAKPLICIYAAPVSLCIAGYIQSAATKSLSFLTVLWAVATVLFVFACVKFVQYLKMPFFPSYAAYTFPFAISAIASKQLMACSAAMEQPMSFLGPIVLIETIIATCTTLYALVRYLMFLFGGSEKKAA
jgi:exfoliative toxin A/B